MTIKSGMFNSVNGDRKYKAEDFAGYFATFIANGVFPDPSDGFKVTANAGMAVILKAGKAWIEGYYITNNADYNLSLDVADGVLKRIDRVVLQLNFADREIMPIIKKGTFASSPVAPILQRNADVYEIALADIDVGQGVFNITQANITDLRLNTNLCGIVHGTVSQVDTTAIFDQYLAWLTARQAEYDSDFTDWTNAKKSDYDTWYATTTSRAESDVATFEAQFQDDFNTWFEAVRDALGESAAGNLLNAINDLAGSGRTTETVKGVADTLAAHLAETAHGIGNFTGDGGETAIPHELGLTPSVYHATPTEDPNGFLGELWIRADDTNIYVGNSGSFTGAFLWIAKK